MSECNDAVFALIGVILGGIIGYFSALRVAKIQQFNQAAAEFRAEFFEQIYKLKQGNEDITTILGEAEYLAHQKAKIAFEPYLSKSNVKLLNEVWEKYYNYRNGIGQNIAPGSEDTRENELPKAQEIIEEILLFASNR